MQTEPGRQSLQNGKQKIGTPLYLCLILLCAITFLPGIGSLPPTDRDEARFVQATRQMAETGDYVDIRLQDVPRYKKPIGIYWLQSAAVIVSGRGADAPIWVYRTVSAIGATVAVLATAWLGAWLFGSWAGFVSGVGLAGIFMLGIEARIAKTDAALLASAVIAQAALARIYLGHRLDRPASPMAPWLFWIAQGAGILIKGPIVPLLSMLTIGGIAVFDRRFDWIRSLRPLRGIVIAVLITAPWLILISYKSGSAFWQESLGRDALAKVTGGRESHGAPPGYYALIYSLFMWPFALMALEAGLKALNRLRADPRILFCCAWYLPLSILFELVPTKLPHYALPAYPALLLLMGWAAVDPAAADIRLARWQVWLRRLALVGHILVTFALAAALVAMLPYLVGTFSVWGLAAAMIALCTGWLGSGLGPALPPPQRIIAITVGAALTAAITTTQVLPALQPLLLSPQIAEAFETSRPCADSRLVSVGYSEPSLIFMTRTDTVLTGAADAAARLSTSGDGCDMALVETGQQSVFFKALPGGEADVVAVRTIEGINYSKGDLLTLTLFRIR